MARRRRQLKRRERRQRSNKLWWVFVVLIVLGTLGYFAFTKIFFDPFEGTQDRFEVLVPHDVDLFVHRRALDSDITTFPTPQLLERLQRTREWRELTATGWWQGLQFPAAVQAFAEQAEETRRAMSEARLDPLDDFLGTEVALVGRLPGAGLGEAQYALMARLSAQAKVAIEGLDIDDIREEAFPGSTMTTVPDPTWPGLTYRRLDIPDEGAWFYSRELDLLVIGRSEVLVRDVLQNVLGTNETSLGLSRLYQGNLPPARGDPDERLSIPFMVDVRQVLERTESDEDLAEESPHAVATALAKLVDLTILERMVGRVELDTELSIKLHADLDDRRAETERAGLLGSRAFRADERMRDAFALVPADTNMVVTFNCDLDALMMTFTESFSSDLLNLLNRSIKDVSKYSPSWRVENLRGPSGLIRQLDRALGDEVTIAVRPADHAFSPGTQPLPAMAFFFRVRSLDTWREIDDALVRGRAALGLDKDDLWQQDEGVGVRKWMKLPAGFPMEEIAWIVLDRETLVVATDLDFSREIVSVYASSLSSLGTRAEARDSVAALGQTAANLALWGSAPRVLELLEPFGEWIAVESTAVDRVAARLTQRNHLIASNYAEYKGREDEMPEALKEQLEARLDNLMSAAEAQRRDQTIPAAAKTWRESRQWLSLFRSVSAALRLGEHDVDLVIHAGTTLGG
jgi:hypothetical protein